MVGDGDGCDVIMEACTHAQFSGHAVLKLICSTQHPATSTSGPQGSKSTTHVLACPSVLSRQHRMCSRIFSMCFNDCNCENMSLYLPSASHQFEWVITISCYHTGGMSSMSRGGTVPGQDFLCETFLRPCGIELVASSQAHATAALPGIWLFNWLTV